MQFLKDWKLPTIIRDIASFIGFLQFYADFIPHFEMRIKRLREIVLKQDYDRHLTANEFDPAAIEEFESMKSFAFPNDSILTTKRTND